MAYSLPCLQAVHTSETSVCFIETVSQKAVFFNFIVVTEPCTSVFHYVEIHIDDPSILLSVCEVNLDRRTVGKNFVNI
jgi:hypothetical protein